jgi:HD-GYP domain-containing protein (c-di-GMP phosphodiesterase class II)
VQAAETADALRRVLEHVRLRRHSAPDRVRLAQAIAQDLALPAGDVAAIGFAAAVHDVGMTLVDRKLIESGETFNEEDRARMQRHVEMGASLLDRIETMGVVREIVMSHHEWWDGTGYPRGLRGEEIPIGARVLAAVDAFESMTMGRAHRSPLSREAAVAELASFRGTQFDPNVVDALERVLPSLRAVDEAERRAETAHAPEGR